MSYYIRYFASQPITAKQIHQGLQAVDPTFKIDLGELVRGDVSLGQIEANQAGDDLFNDDVARTLQLVGSRSGGAAAVPRLKAARTIVVVGLDWGSLGSETVLGLAAPLWDVLARLSPGLSHWDDSGIFDGGQPLVDLSR